MAMIFSVLLKLLGLFVALTVLYVLAALLLPMITTDPAEEAGQPANHQAFLHGNGVHIDIILHRDDLPDSLQQQLSLTPYTKYVAFGWGDQGFYLNTPTWAELKVSTALEAMLVKSPSAMHVTDHNDIKEDWHPVALTVTQLRKLLDYLRDGFATTATPDGEKIIIEIEEAGYTPKDRFYEGVGNYHALNTCNTWVNRALKKAGLRTGIWAANQHGVLRHFPKREN